MPPKPLHEHLLVYDSISGQSRTLIVDSTNGIPCSNLQDLLDACFKTKVVAFKDANGVLYPIAGVAKKPSALAGKIIETVTMSELNENDNAVQHQMSRQNATSDLFQELPPLTLQESIKEIQIFTGLGEMDLLSVIRLLPQNRNIQEGYTERWPIDRLPSSIDRQDWLELMTDVAAHAYHSNAKTAGDYIGPPPDEELLNLLFDVLGKSSRDFRHSQASSRRLSDTVEVSVLASGLSLLCGGDEGANMYGVFLLHAQRTQSHWAGIVPELAIYHHLCAVFRLIFQLNSKLAESVGCTAEDLARHHSVQQLEALPHRDFLGSAGGQGLLSADEFCHCCVNGVRQGLNVLYATAEKQRIDAELAAHDLPPLYDDDTHGRAFRASDNRPCADRFFPKGRPGVHFWEVHRDEEAHFPEGRPGEHVLKHRSAREQDLGYGEDESTYSGLDSNTNDAKAFSAQSSIEGDTDRSQADLSQLDGSPNANLEDSLVAASLVEFDGGPIDVSKVQQLLGLRKHEPEALLSSLVFAADEDGSISLTSYHRLMDNLVGRHYAELTVLQRSVVDYIVATLYSSFTEDSEWLKIEQIGWALLPFAGGTSQSKAEAAVQLLGTYVDLDVQQGVTAVDMCTCITAVLSGICSLDYRFLAPLSAEQVSFELTMHAFTHAASEGGLPRCIDFDDFKHWFSVIMQQFDNDVDELSHGDSSFTVGSLSREGSQTEEIEELRSSVCSGTSEHTSATQPSVDTDEWRSAIHHEQQRQRLKLQANMNYRQSAGFQAEAPSDVETEDSDANAGFAAVHPEPRFAAYDIDDSVDLNDSQQDSDKDESASDMPSDSQSTEDLFAEYADDDSEQAQDWETAKGAFTNGQPVQDAPVSSSAVVLELRRARALLGLDGFPAEDLLEVLGDHAREGALTLRRWMQALRHVVRLAGGKEKELEQAQALGYKLFVQFADASSSLDDDSRAEQTVSYVMFTVGLTCLCSSSVADKVAVACTLLDHDSDSCITIDQFELLVLCMLRVIYGASTLAAARVSSANCTLEDLASLVTGEACSTFALKESDVLDVPKVLEICGDYVRLATQ